MFTITVSQTEINPELVAAIVAQYGLSADIVPGLSVVKGRIEQRAEVRVFNGGPGTARELFRDFRRTFDLTCAWYDGPEGQGCILEIFPDLKPSEPFPRYADRVPRVSPSLSPIITRWIGG